MRLTDAFIAAITLLLEGDRELWGIIALSVRTSLFALAIALGPGVALGYAIAQMSFPMRRIAVWLIQASLAIPTVLVGLLLYLLLSRQGLLGGLHWLFAQPGLVFGQALIALPVLAALTLAAVQACDPRVSETAVVLGAKPWAVMRTVLSETRFAVMAAVINAYARVISEVGCALMVGGNIAGDTRTVTTAIALQTSKGEFAQGIALGLILLLVALVLNAGLMLIQGDVRKMVPQ